MTNRCIYCKPFFWMVVGLCWLASSDVWAQYKVKKKGENKSNKSRFERSQWWLGLKIGGNLTQATPTARYSVLTSTASNILVANSFQKNYQDFSQVGFQFGAILTYNFYQNLSLSFQPAYYRLRYRYTNNYTWQDPTVATNILTMSYTHTQTADYLDLPLTIRYEFLQDSRVKPYLQAGGYVGVLLNASKNIEIKGNDQASGTGAFSAASTTVGTGRLYQSISGGLLFGGGVNADFGNLRISLECNYRLGLSNLTNRANRFSDPRLTGIGDVPDDLMANNLEMTLGLMFPLKYLVKDYKKVNP